MADTTFVNGVTLTDQDWFNDVNRLHYTIFGDPADAQTANKALQNKGANIASAATVDLTTATGDFVHITGTTTITAFTITSGDQWTLVFDGSLTLTNNGSILLPGGASIVTQAGDTCIMRGDGANIARCIAYVPAATAVLLPAGVVMDYAGASAPTGWLECDGSAVSRATYLALFTNVGTTWGAGDGATTFNLPDFRGKHRIGKGTGTVVASGVDADVNTATDTFAVASNNDKWRTGMQVVLTISSGTITGVSTGNTYYIIRASSTTVKLASTLALAQAGTAIDLTAKANPTWSFTHTYTARSLGEYGGKETHAQATGEESPHNHTQNAHSHTQTGGINSGTAGNNFATTTTTEGLTPTTQSVTATNQATAGGNAMSIMNPFATVMSIIKT